MNLMYRQKERESDVVMRVTVSATVLDSMPSEGNEIFNHFNIFLVLITSQSTALSSQNTIPQEFVRK